MNVVIVGTGHAACQLAASLRERKYEGDITLIGREPGPTYQKPLLSKGFLLGKVAEPNLVLKPAAFFEQKRIAVIEAEVTAIDRAAKQVAGLPYDHLVLATGAENRRLTVPGAGLDGVVMLRSQPEALALRARLAGTKRIVIVGAGFIGMEVAAVAAQLGLEVIVVEQGERALARAVSLPVSRYLLARHWAGGVRFHFGAALAGFEGEGSLRAVHLADGTVIPTTLALVAIGVVPNMALAAQVGLATGNGIEVDARLATTDRAIHAIGDAAGYPHPLYDNRRVRVESIQNAMDQARCLAQTLTGVPTVYAKLPWFWSDQWDIRLQIAGVGAPGDQAVLRGSPEEGRFSVFRLDAEGRLSAVESINQAGEHMAARALVARRPRLEPSQIRDPEFPLQQLAAA
ncbi:NAD(P)/FAD-dependent oxidoreductase [Rhodovarius crocodyli]|nr:FAD-dependent oxidoreductase [Rhodovarius crocodyli]